MITAHEMEARDIIYVLRQPWNVSADEFAIDRTNCCAAIDRVENLWINSTRTVALRDGEKTVAVIGMCPGEGGVWYTWFLASELFEKVGRSATRLIRRLLHGTMSEFEIERMVSLSASTRHDAERWFSFLGFSRAKNYDGNGKRGFEMKGVCHV